MPITLDGTTGVTAAAFDGALDAADLTGSLPAVSGAALINLAAPTTAQVLTALSGLSSGAVGTFATLVASGNITQGSTYAGSSLYWGSGMGYFFGSHRWEDGTVFSVVSSTLSVMGSPSGTWRALGSVSVYGSGGPSSKTIYGTALFVRIS